jgi:FkbM family methyltransferase
MNYMQDMLLRLRNRGATPTGFIDAGAHFGETQNIIRSVFPDKRVVSFEANPFCEPMLKQAGGEYIICLLGRETKEKVEFYLNPNDLTSTGCSIYKETGHFFENAAVREIPMYRLDDVVPVEANLNFLKMDVQGAEIDILEGAAKLLPTIKWIYLEVSFIKCNEGAPLFDFVFDYMRKKQYRVADIVDPTWLDNQLIQCNFLFEKI